MEHKDRRKSWAKESMDSNANLAWSKKGTFETVGGGACHGSFSGSGRPNMLDMLYSARQKLQEVVKTSSKATDLDVERVYYEWLLKESPWAEAYFDKDYDDVVKYGFSIRTDLPHDFVASACVATRFLTEKYSGSSTWVINRIPTFAELVKTGMPTVWAFVMANMYNKNGSGKYSYSMPNGHEMLPPNWTIRAIKNFVTGDYNKAGPTFYNNGGYKSIGTAWRHSETSAHAHTSDLARKWGVKKDNTINYNIFEPLDTGGGYPALEFEALLRVQKEIEEALKDV
jgi:hypothetical protein